MSIRSAVFKILLASLLVLFSVTSFADTKFTSYVNDALGSPVVAMNQAGDVIWRKTYQPYGKASGNDRDNRIGYTGHVEDKPDLVYAGARYYDPALGILLSDDPVRFTEKNPMSFNRYAYANNNPYKFVDPDGQNAVTAFGGLLYETGQLISGNGFNANNLGGALVDGYNGEGAGFASSAFEDATSFVPAEVVLGGVVKIIGKGVVAAKGGMLGERGVQTFSKTLWKGEGKARIDVENPNPGQRAGQLHYQDNAGNKYLYDPKTNSFPDAPKSVNGLLEDTEFQNAIKKGMTKYLGE